MSYDRDDSVWISDLDGYISIGSSNHWNSIEEEQEKDWYEEQQEHKECEFYALGDITLLDGSSIRLQSSNYIGLNLSDWSWAIHQAEKSIGVNSSGKILEKELINALISLGRKYAIFRYSKWEKIPSASAITASLPLGFKALLLQYLSGQDLLTAIESRSHIWNTLCVASSAKNIVAYQRVRQVQDLIHKLAFDAFGTLNHTYLNRNATREILSLARLHYSVDELRFNDFSSISKLVSMYALARETVEGKHTNGKYIPNWQKRHLRPLIDLYPYSIRRVLLRGSCHANSDIELQRQMAINELALVEFDLLLMRIKYNK